MAVAANEQASEEQDAQRQNISAAEAADVIGRAVRDLRRDWVQATLSVANIVNSGQTVGRGTFDDVRRLRENWEELERARSFLRGARAQEIARQAETAGDQIDPGEKIASGA